MRRLSRALRVALIGGLLSLLALSANAHPLRYFWRYEPIHFRDGHSWESHRMLRRLHVRWHDRWGPARRHPHKHADFHHEKLVHRERSIHYHEQVAKKTGEASWYAAPGEVGACGVELRGLYAAHRHWPCGTLVSVRKGSRHVFVRVRDRGPWTDGRIIDLSRKAFKRLADPDVGVLDVTIYRLRG